MGYEIERKFLVSGDTWRSDVKKHFSIRQAHLAKTDKASIRIRIIDEDSATMTVKSAKPELVREEYIYPVPLDEARRLIDLRSVSLIEKTRYLVPVGSDVWEIDVFHGENDGLVIGEIELTDASQSFMYPDWIGEEVTGNPRYYNYELSLNPFERWAEKPGQSWAADFR